MFLGGQHENGENEHCSQEHLDEQASDDRGATSEGCRYIHGRWEQARDDSSSCDGTDNLADEDEQTTGPFARTDEAKGEGDLLRN